MPHWREDDGELIYLDPDRRIMAVSVEPTDRGLILGSPEELFRFEKVVVSFDASKDHKRFLVASLAAQDQDLFSQKFPQRFPFKSIAKFQRYSDPT